MKGTYAKERSAASPTFSPSFDDSKKRVMTERGSQPERRTSDAATYTEAQIKDLLDELSANLGQFEQFRHALHSNVAALKALIGNVNLNAAIDAHAKSGDPLSPELIAKIQDFSSQWFRFAESFQLVSKIGKSGHVNFSGILGVQQEPDHQQVTAKQKPA